MILEKRASKFCVKLAKASRRKLPAVEEAEAAVRLCAASEDVGKGESRMGLKNYTWVGSRRDMRVYKRKALSVLL